MFTVKTPQEASEMILTSFSSVTATETVPLAECRGRFLAEDILAAEYVPDFDRSTVDGYAVVSSDTFGCSDSIPAILTMDRSVNMGEMADFTIDHGHTAYVPTGASLPGGADAVVMIEYTEDYADGTIGILKPASPGLNRIFRGDDVYPDKPVLFKGHKLGSPDIGALAAMGITEVPVSAKPLVGIISTGDELIPSDQKPSGAQIRDVNSPMLRALCEDAGASVKSYGIIRDDESLLKSAIELAVKECDIVLVSGGSSVGAKDAAQQAIEAHGTILFHGIAMKPGKPTILGSCSGKPVFGLPGHPVAAYFVSDLFVRPLIVRMSCGEPVTRTVRAALSEAVNTNHGRAEYIGVRLRRDPEKVIAEPIRTKSGLITSLACSDGYFCAARDCEGLPAGAEVEVTVYD